MFVLKKKFQVMSKLPNLSKRKSPDSPLRSQNVLAPKKLVKIKSGKKKEDPIMVKYIKYYREVIAKYGPHTALLLQVGKFYECYNYDVEDGTYSTNAHDIADITGIQIGKYNSNSPLSVTNPERCGVTKEGWPKYINMLLDENYTVVQVEQLNNAESGDPIERKITNVMSPGVNNVLCDFNYNNTICLVIENQNSRDNLLHRIDQYELCVGMACVDVSSNTSTVYEMSSTRTTNPELAINEAYRFLQTHNCKELFVLLENFNVTNEKEEKKLKRYFHNALELDRYYVHHCSINTIPKEFKKAVYQNKFLKKVFGSEVCGPGVSPVEYLGLQMYPNSVLSYCCLVDFIYQRNESYLENMQKPEWWENDSHLVLTHNAIRQLDITRTAGSNIRGKNSSLFNIINHTVTNQGKRLLESRLLHPFLNEKKLEESYSQIQDIYDVESKCASLTEPSSPLQDVRKMFRDIGDFQRFHRKREMGTIHPDELHNLFQSYQAFIDIIDWFYMQCDEHPDITKHIALLLPDEDTLKQIRLFNNQFYKVYDFDALKRNGSFKTIQENLFKPGVDAQLDDISEHLGNVEERLDKMRVRLCDVVDYTTDKNHKTVILRVLKNGSKMFRSNIISGAVLMWYKNKIREELFQISTDINDLDKVKVVQYKNPIDLYYHEGREMNNPDILEWAKNKKLSTKIENSDEEEDEEDNTHAKKLKYMSVSDMKLVLSLDFRRNKSNMNITTPLISKEEQSTDEYTEKLLEVMHEKSTQFLNNHYQTHETLIPIFQHLSGLLDLIQSHARTAIRYQYFKPTVVKRRDDSNTLLPSFIDIKGFRHPIIERVQDDIQYIKNDIKLGRETFDDDNITAMLLFALNNSGKTACEKAVALNVVLAQAGSFVPADSFRFRTIQKYYYAIRWYG